jgi:hypothetical protein
MSIYTEMVAAGIEVDHHESDLYVPVTPEATAILRRHPDLYSSSFTHQRTCTRWYEIPFMFDPWWEARTK